MNKEEILDRFFKDELSQNELQGYLDRGEISDSDLLAYSYLSSALEKNDTSKARQYLQSLEKENKKSWNWKAIIFTSIAIMLLIVFSFYSLKKGTQENNQDVNIKQYAFLYPSEVNARSNDSISTSEIEVLSQAKIYYANSEYELFVNLYVKNKEILPLTDPLQLQYISSLIALEKYDKVLSVQNDIICKSPECIQNMEWYKLISLVATDKIDEAKSILNNIQKNPNHLFYSDSKKLLDAITK